MTPLNKHLFLLLDPELTSPSTGWGIYILNNQERIAQRIPSVCYIFTAEAAALINALHLVRDRNIQDTIIISDSLSVCLAVQSSESPQKSNYTIPLIKTLFHQITERGQGFTLVWIPGHCGISGNEHADRIANQARGMETIQQFSIPLSDLITVTRTHIQKAHVESLQQQFLSTGKRYHDICPEIKTRPWFAEM